MKYLPILGELFESDSVIFMLFALFIGTIAIGGVVGFLIGWVMFKIRGMHNDKDN